MRANAPAPLLFPDSADSDLRGDTAMNDQQRNERGAGLVEYGLLVALICVVCISAVAMLGNTNSGNFEDTASKVASASE